MYDASNCRADVHVLARIDPEIDSCMSECLCCGLPVPAEVKYDVYCGAECKDQHFSGIILENFINENLQSVLITKAVNT